jgi:poly-gamma-glutamate synthesis protein (capsule biosynthesis protein)
LAELLIAGDVNLKRDGALDATALDLVRPVLEAADLRIGNLEGAFSDPSVEIPFKPGWFHCEREQADVLRGLFDALGCANNVHHGAAVGESLALLDGLGIAHTGAGADLAGAREPAVIEAGGVRLGLLARTWVYWPTGHAAAEGAPGVATLRAHTAYEPGARLVEMPGTPAAVHTWPDAEELAAACEDVRALAARVDHVVVLNHWGISLDPQACAYQRLAAHAFIDAGATVVAGSHSHTLQGAELHGDGVAFYGLGNFVFGWKLHRGATRDGLLARVRLDRERLLDAAVHPVSRSDADQAQVLDPRTGLGAELAATFTALCAPLGTTVTPDSDRLVLGRQA